MVAGKRCVTEVRTRPREAFLMMTPPTQQKDIQVIQQDDTQQPGPLSRDDKQLAVYRLLFETASSLLTETNSDNLLQNITEQASQLLGADRASLFLFDPARNELWSKVALGQGIPEIRFPATTGIAGLVAMTGETANIHDAYQHPAFNPEIDRRTGYKTQSILCGPIRNIQNHVVGVLEVLNKQNGVFDTTDEEALRALCSFAAVAISNNTLVEELDQRIWRTEAVLDVMRSLASKLELDELLQTIMAKVTSLLRADRASLFLLDTRKGELWSKVAQGAGTLEIRFPRHIGIAGYVATSGKLLNVQDAYKDPRFNRDVDKETGYRTRSILCAPIRNESGHIIGVVEVLNKVDGVFLEEDEDLLVALTSQVGIALENARLFEELQAMKLFNDSILSTVATGIVTLDADGMIGQVNPAAQRILGLEDPCPHTIHFTRWLDGTQLSSLVSAIEDVFRLQEPAHVYHHTFKNAHGNTIGANITIKPLAPKGTQHRGIVLVIEDVTQLLTAFTRYVSPQVADRVLNEPATSTTLGGVAQHVTVLFSDIRGFTTLSEHSSPEEMVKFLNEYFARMVNSVFKYGGTLDKYIGDAIMAVFGAPTPHKDDAARAVQCALEMRTAVWAFNEERAAEGLPHIEIGIGIYSGLVASGNIGTIDRMDYTVIGDAVNVAARLQELTKKENPKILMDAETYASVKGQVVCDAVGDVTIRGRTASVNVYGVSDEWLKSERVRVPDTRVRRNLPPDGVV